MKIATNRIVAGIVSSVITFALFAARTGVHYSIANGLGTQSDQNSAMNNPDKFVWELFVAISKPANNGTNDALWETWVAEDDVFGDPNATPVWPGTTPQLQHKPKKLKAITQLKIALEEAQRQPRRQPKRKKGTRPLPQFIPPQTGSGEEVRMNKPTFDFIVANNLWYIEGQVSAFDNGAKIDFPTDSKEIKAIWQPITEEQKPRFHWQPNPLDGNKPYGLVALHVISKDLPNWTWATFEQMDNPNRCKILRCHDSFGITSNGEVSAALLAMFKNAGLGSDWQYYRLDGSQTDFTDAAGIPALLGDSITEDGFVSTSSCLTCHARSTIGPTAAGQKANRLAVFQSTSPLESYNGTPNPSWFFGDPTKPATRKYLQLDFLWSLRNAQHKTQ
jgi:hypothetical protein